MTLVYVNGTWINPGQITRLGKSGNATEICFGKDRSKVVSGNPDEVAAIINAAELNLDKQVASLIANARAAVAAAEKVVVGFREQLAGFEMERQQFRDKIALLEAELAGKTA